ncbi:MAG: hypothetical protein PUB04_04995 [Clostridia bacterium]|nr:hypothetical protein [Clostridia bacterium]
MKFRYYIRGFGAGLIVAAIILTIAGMVERNNDMLNNNSNNNTETQSAGSVIAFTSEASTEGSTQMQQTDSETSSETAAQETTAAETIQETTVAPTQTNPPTEKSTVKITTGDGSGEVEIVFKGVYTAVQAADILYDAGIIDNKTEFYTYMYTTGYDRKMRDGVYTLKPGDSYETIARIITQTR